MVRCECGKIFEKSSSLKSHARFCDRYIRKTPDFYNPDNPKNPRDANGFPRGYEYNSNRNYGDKDYKDLINESGTYDCVCGKNFPTLYSMIAHSRWCVTFRKGIEPINTSVKGVMQGWDAHYSKDEQAEFLRRAKETFKRRRSSGEIKPSFLGRSHNKRTRNIMSKVQSGLVKQRGSNYRKRFDVFDGEKMVVVNGYWEKMVAEWLLSRGIRWTQTTLIYDEFRRYTSDFYIESIDLHIEVKGWMREYDIYRMQRVVKEHNIDLRLIEKSEIYKLNDFQNLEDLPKFMDRYGDHEINFDLIKNRLD